MDALISGQAGVAVLIQGNEVSVLELQAQERELPCSTADIPYLFAGANDVCEMRATARTVVLTRLKAAWRSDRALQFTLISLDNSESIENRELAIQCLAELFNDRDIYQHVGNRLSSAPLPSGSDLKTALTLAGTMQPLAIFLRELQRNQGQIARIRAAWDSLSDSLFGTQSAKQEFFEVAVSKGAFRVLADAASDSSSFGLATIQCHKGLMGLPNYRKVLQAWLGQLNPTRATMTLPELSNRQAE